MIGCYVESTKKTTRIDLWIMIKMTPWMTCLGQYHLQCQLVANIMQNFNSPKKGISFGTLLENQEHSLFEGMMGSDGINNGSMSQLGCSSSKPDLSMVNPLKRTLSSLYWTDEDTAGPSTSKRFHGDSNDGSMEKTDGNGSFATLLSQLPQTPPLQQQTMLGSMGNGIFRPPYQLPGLNWYS